MRKTPPLSRIPHRQGAFVFEITQRCNHHCLYCYNVWNNAGEYPQGELNTTETLELLSRMLDQTGAGLVSLSGGEPLLRSDVYDILSFLHERGVAVNLITNGTLLDGAAIARLADRVSIFELPLLSVEAAVHDRMSGAPGAFERVTLAIASLKAAGQHVVAVFVATRCNLSTWHETAELAFALGVDGILFNRFNPGGEGRRNLALLQVGPEELTRALDAAEKISREFDLPISCSIPMPPCLFDTGRYRRLSFGFCAAGSEQAYYTLDPLGNVRPCNHSATLLGNIRDTSFAEMVEGERMGAFLAARPAFCAGCAYEERCRGGCKAAAEACSGSPAACDPFLAAFAEQATKPERAEGATRN